MTNLRLKFIHSYTDRHGHVRHYFRRKGSPKVALPGLAGSAEFMAAYHAALADKPAPAPAARPSAGSLAEVVAGYCRSVDWKNLKPSSQRTYRKALDPIVERYGHCLVAEWDKATKNTPRDVIEAIGEHHPGMANLTKAVLSKVMNYAIDAKVCERNPFDRLKSYRLGSHHSWTDAEIAQFERRWKIGTRERLAFALLLYTGQRGGDVCKMHRNDIADGMIRVSRQKVRKGETSEALIPIHSELAKVLAGPVVGMAHLVTTAQGKALRGMWTIFPAAVARAGLPENCVAHGLRKAAARRLAEAGCTPHEIAAITGHATLKEIERYTAAVSQEALAKKAMGRVSG